MKITKISLYIIGIIIIIFFGILYIPVIFISKEGQKCLVNTNCIKLNNICEKINKKIPKNELGQVEPMCIDSTCRCEWPGVLLHF
jgi:uncharacterized membrane protein (Fun14 family)